MSSQCFISRPLGLSLLNFNLLFLRPSGSGIPKSFGEWVVINLELSDLLVLVGRDADELRLLEDVRPKC